MKIAELLELTQQLGIPKHGLKGKKEIITHIGRALL